jgi:lipoyl-dependent peroxiredoxin subunit D
MKMTVKPDKKDILLNLDRVLQFDPASTLSDRQIHMVATAVAYSTRSQRVLDIVSDKIDETLTEEELTAARGAAALMAMNNVYYRSLHLLSDQSYLKQPANLRMTFMKNPGCSKIDFELMSMAVSALAGCGMCLDAHEKTLRQHDVSQGAIGHTIKIAAVLNAFAQVIATDALS